MGQSWVWGPLEVEAQRDSHEVGYFVGNPAGGGLLEPQAWEYIGEVAITTCRSYSSEWGRAFPCWAPWWVWRLTDET